MDHTWFRKNENRAGRWTSPDPYNGSMKIGDPQSFNRYSYVENQPTNFVDPSGLLMMQPRPREMSSMEICWRYGICSNPVGPTGGGEEEFPGGGGLGGGGAGDGPAVKTQFSNCDDFATYLYQVATGSNFGNHSALEVGTRLFGERSNDFSRSKADGFLTSLIEPYQGIGVYRHIVAHAGAYLIPGGSIPSYGQELRDIYQQYAPSWFPGGSSQERQEEAVADRAGNAAGWKVGEHISSFFSSNKTRKDYDNLKKAIKSTLCSGGGQ